MIWGLQSQLVKKGTEEIWGYEVKKRVKGYLQMQLIERGLDWIYTLGVWIQGQVQRMLARTKPAGQFPSNRTCGIGWRRELCSQCHQNNLKR